MAKVDEMERPTLGAEEARNIVDTEPAVAPTPYDWETDVEQTDMEAADPLNPNYVTALFNADQEGTPDCPYFVNVWGEKQDTFRPSRNPKPKTYNSNNGTINFVDETGAVYAVTGGDEVSARLHEQGYESDGSMTVFLSNGEHCGSREGNERLIAGERIQQSKKMGLTIESMGSAPLEGSVEYTPSLQTSAEYIETLEDSRTQILEQIAELEAAPSGIGGDTDNEQVAAIERFKKRARELEETIKGRLVLESIGVPVSPELNQVNYDLGRYSVVTDHEGQEVVRYVDCHGRYMEAPYSGMAIETLEIKGYRQKVEKISGGVTETPSTVAGPRVLVYRS